MKENDEKTKFHEEAKLRGIKITVFSLTSQVIRTSICLTVYNILVIDKIIIEGLIIMLAVYCFQA